VKPIDAEDVKVVMAYNKEQILHHILEDGRREEKKQMV
jgi:hypothetical protein